jgi:hypothetical protein
MVLRFIHASFGAFLGAAFGAANAFWIFDEFNWNLTSICAGICGVLAFVWGEPFIEWLKENWWWD